MTNLEIDQQMHQLVKSERKITRQILELIVQAEHQRLPLERGFKDTYDWLIRGHGYSASAANRRIQAARLLREIPEVATKVESGELSLTSLWQTQRTIRAQQKATGQRVTRQEKQAALEQIEGLTSESTERTLHTLFPEAEVTAQRIVHKHNGGLGLTIELSEEEARELKRAQELLSHALPGATLAQVIARLAREFNQRKDPLARKVKPKAKLPAKPQAKSQDKPQNTTQSSTATRQKIIQEADGKCSYQDPVTGRVCGSTYQLEIDHFVPRALGGIHEETNLRCLCRKHNNLSAEQQLGRAFMDRKRNRSSEGGGRRPSQ